MGLEDSMIYWQEQKLSDVQYWDDIMEVNILYRVEDLQTIEKIDNPCVIWDHKMWRHFPIL